MRLLLLACLALLCVAAQARTMQAERLEQLVSAGSGRHRHHHGSRNAASAPDAAPAAEAVRGEARAEAAAVTVPDGVMPPPPPVASNTCDGPYRAELALLPKPSAEAYGTVWWDGDACCVKVLHTVGEPQSARCVLPRPRDV